MTGLKRHLSLSQRLLALTVIALLPALAALTYLIVAFHGEREREVHALALRTSELATLEMDRIITGAEGTLFALSRSRLIRTFAAPECDSYLSEVNTELPQLRAIAAIDTMGNVRCSSEPSMNSLRLDASPYFRDALRKATFVVGEYTRSQLDAEIAFLPLALPIINQGQVVGVLAAGLDLAWLGEQIRGRRFPEGSALTIADREGIILAREPLPERFVGTRIPDEFQPLVHADRPDTMEVTSQDGTRRVIGFYPPAVTGSGLYVSSGISTKAAFAPVYVSTYRSLGLAAAGTVVAFAFAWMAGGRLIREPIMRLVATVEAWRGGDATARTGISNDGNELSKLAFAIDRYMDELVADRAARQKAEAHRELLFKEMDHRIKNILATVQAITRQSLRGKATPEGVRDLECRLAAMADTHAILLSENWQHADLRATVEAAIHPFGVDGGSRLSVEGPSLRITARAALALSMVIHELGTNAAKYGALSETTGTVAIAWHLTSKDGCDRFVFKWTEHDGPPVKEPARSGFGTRLMKALLTSDFGAEVTLRFPNTGVVFELDADPDRILTRPDLEEGAAA